MAVIMRRLGGWIRLVVGLGGHRPRACRAGQFLQSRIAGLVTRNYAVSGFSPWRCDSVKISTPVVVTPTECSNCADSERSRVTAVQPSERIFTCGLPRLIIGSCGEKQPGFCAPPPPGPPDW